MVDKIIKYQNIILAQLVSSLIFLGVILRLNILPTMYIIILFVLLLLLLILTQVSFKKKKHQYRKKTLSLLISICLLTVSIYASQGYNFISKISNAQAQVHVVSLLVLNDSDIKTINDIKDYTINFSSISNSDRVGAALTEIEKTIQVEYEIYDDANTMIKDLYDGVIDVILCDELVKAYTDDSYGSLTSDTFTVWEYTMTENVNILKEVDILSEPFNIYLSGIDTYGDVTTVSRSDVNLVVTINPNTNQILITTIPRDYYIPLAMNDKNDKLTHAGMYGVSESVATIEKLLDIDINYYASVNFSSLINIVDALGGITVDSPYGFTCYTNNNVKISKGINNLNGEQALAFVRERYSLPNGDLDRGINQQIALKAMIEKFISPTVITNYSSILSAISDSFVTNMSMKNIQSIIKYQLLDNPSWEIYMLQATGTFGDEITYSFPGGYASVVYPDSSVQTISNAIKLVMFNQMYSE